MQQIEVQLREGMARQGIAGAAAEAIVTSITSFALYGFPESHAASFALIAYASGYLKAHYPAAFYTALLNNQPMGFYHPATLVKDAQRRGVHFSPIDVQRVGLGLPHRAGRRDPARFVVREWLARPRSDAPLPRVSHRRPTRAAQPKRCPKCGCEDESMIETTRAQAAGSRLQAVRRSTESRAQPGARSL